MKNLKLNLIFFLIIASFLGIRLTAQAQLLTPPGLNWTQGSDVPSSYVLIGRTTNAHNSTPDTEYKLTVDGGTVQYGNKTSIYSLARSVANSNSSQGVARASMSTVADWIASGAVVGVSGVADSVSFLDVSFANNGSSALGGSFFTRILDPIQSPTVGTYNIAGVRTILDGTITTFPQNGVVAALYANDLIQVNGTWGAFVDGRGHFSQNVGIRTTNPLSTLSVGGDGNSLYTTYSFSNSSTSGASAIVGEAATGPNASAHVIGVRGLIQSGTGYTYGVHGSATNPTANNSGRSYGVYGVAGNATNGANYGVYARLSGTNTGTALLARDDVNHAGVSELLGSTRTWAGYFIGDVEVTNDGYINNRLAIACDDFTAGGILPPTGSTATYRLVVNGGILGRELFINNSNWCDYVFEEDYELISLEAVEAHIQEKGYLPNTPSAAEIEAAQGIELGEMTRLQQEKIEEIFLHLIDLNKEMETLKAENAALRAELEKRQ